MEGSTAPVPPGGAVLDRWWRVLAVTARYGVELVLTEAVNRQRPVVLQLTEAAPARRCRHRRPCDPWWASGEAWWASPAV